MTAAVSCPESGGMTRVYGWKPDLPDRRDRYLSLEHVDAASLPLKFSLRDKMPPVWNQGALGACTAFSSLGAVVYERQLQLPDTTEPWFSPSFLQVYYSTRAIENSVQIDAGAYIRDTCKVLAQCGAAPADLWPYDESKFAQKPPKRALLAALDNRVTSYQRVRRTVNEMRRVIAGGDTIVFGISVYESFESSRVASTGMVPMPKDSEDLLGGHAVLMVGYDHERELFECRNSWGSLWGDDGYFWLPYAYVQDADLSDDFWTLKTVAQPTAASYAYVQDADLSDDFWTLKTVAQPTAASYAYVQDADLSDDFWTLKTVAQPTAA